MKGQERLWDGDESFRQWWRQFFVWRWWWEGCVVCVKDKITALGFISAAAAWSTFASRCCAYVLIHSDICCYLGGAATNPIEKIDSIFSAFISPAAWSTFTRLRLLQCANPLRYLSLREALPKQIGWIFRIFGYGIPYTKDWILLLPWVWTKDAGVAMR